MLANGWIFWSYRMNDIGVNDQFCPRCEGDIWWAISSKVYWCGYSMFASSRGSSWIPGDVGKSWLHELGMANLTCCMEGAIYTWWLWKAHYNARSSWICRLTDLACIFWCRWFKQWYQCVQPITIVHRCATRKSSKYFVDMVEIQNLLVSTRKTITVYACT